ncbi:hypothetical protein AB0D34_14515 [Streptomyces sp. NPDC048420]|uniref:hypothetical protein n=1 Tax=Streptomyces sp. NPDC048420 TaxID=3155755 RepID=UPI0034367E75
MTQDLTAHTGALVLRTGQLLQAVRQASGEAGDPARLPLPLAKDVRSALQDMAEMCRALGAEAPQPLHGADLERCAEHLDRAAGRWTSILMNDMCLGGD